MGQSKDGDAKRIQDLQRMIYGKITYGKETVALNNIEQIKNTRVNSNKDRCDAKPKQKTNIRVIHKKLGKGHIHSISGNIIYIEFPNGNVSKFRFPDIFTSSAYGGILDIEDGLVNSHNAIRFLDEQGLIKLFETDETRYINRGKHTLRIQECVDRYYLLKELHKRGFVGFLHTTDFDNFKSIYETRKMMPRSVLEKNNIKFKDCALTEIIHNTGADVKSSNRFYYRHNTPTNYKAFNDCKQTRPVIFVLDPICIYDKSVVFYDGNARANKTVHTTSAAEALYNYNWNCIFSQLPASPEFEETKEFVEKQRCDIDDLKRMQNAEFLFGDEICLPYFRKIYFRTLEDYNDAIKLYRNDSKFELKPELFPKKRSYYG